MEKTRIRAKPSQEHNKSPKGHASQKRGLFSSSKSTTSTTRKCLLCTFRELRSLKATLSRVATRFAARFVHVVGVVLVVLLASLLSLPVTTVPAVAAYPPPTVTGINPAGGMSGTVINNAVVSGSDFRSGGVLDVRLEKSGCTDITGTDITYLDSTTLRCDIDLSGASVGHWDVKVTHTDDSQYGVKENAFMVTSSPPPVYPPPTLTTIIPAQGNRGQTLNDIQIDGSDFRDISMTVQIKNDGYIGTPITGTDVQFVSANQITADFIIPSGATVADDWDFFVQHGDDGKNDTLLDVFEVQEPEEPEDPQPPPDDEDPDDPEPTPTPEPTTYTYYLAEGCSANGFETFILIQNPNAEPVDVTVTFIREGFDIEGPVFSLEGESRSTVNMADYAGESYSTATEVTSTKPVFVEKSMYWNDRAGGHGTVSSSTPSKTWYFAEGSTGEGFSTYLYVLNPNQKSAKVDLTYMTPSGEVKGPQIIIPPRFRESVNVADTVPETWSVSARIESDIPVVVERCIYINGMATGHSSIGVTEMAAEWYLPEGSTGGDFETWILVMNPNQLQATVSLTYMTEDGPVIGPSSTLGPFQRDTFNVADTVPSTWSVSTRVTSNQPVIAERAMYWNNRQGAHDSIGVTSTSKKWCIPEGCTGGDFETWILVQNPDTKSADIQITYMTETGPIIGPSFELQPNSRKSINVAETVPDCWSVSTMVDASAPVIVARAVYWHNRVDGHDTVGIPSTTKGE